MSKKILFMSSAKLTAISIGLLLAVFCTIGMSFRPVYDEDEEAEIVMSGQKRAHWVAESSDGCGGTNYTYKNKTDYGRAIATVSGAGGTVSIAGSITNGTQSISGNGTTTATLTWNTNTGTSNGEKDLSVHSNNVTLIATPATGYAFVGWYDKDDNFLSGKEEYPQSVTIPGGVYEKGTIKTEAQATDKYGNWQSSGSPYTETFYAKFKEIEPVDLTFLASEGGSYTITINEQETTVSSSDVVKTGITTSVSLSATPATGYVFTGWYQVDGNEVLSELSSDASLSKSFSKNLTIGARFVSKQTGQFQIGSTTYYGLKAATIAAQANDVIIPVAEETVVDGSDLLPLDNGIYTIPANVKLLIPYNSSNSFQTLPKVVTTAATLSAYRKLVLMDGVNIVVSDGAAVCVGGQAMAASGSGTGGHTGYTTGACGLLDMSRGGHLELNSGATLFCWGFVKGQDMEQGNNTQDVGTITVNSNAIVWENFSVGDWRGGSATGSIMNTRFFPFQNYFTQNIEVPTTYKYGAYEWNYFTLNATGGPYDTKFTIIGNENCLFKLTDANSKVRKWYDPTTDLICYELSGSAVLDELKIKITGIPLIGTLDIQSSNYDLPITTNMHIILTDCNMSLTKPMVIQPGAIIEIKQSATVTLSNNLFLYDKDEWGPWVTGKYFRSNSNLTTHKNRGDGSSNEYLDDATFLINGTLNISDGKLYTTASGAALVSSGGGVLTYPATLPSSSSLKWYKGATTSGEGETGTVAVNVANMCNEDESYTQAVISTTFLNFNGRWFTQAAATANKSDHTYDFTYISSGAVSGTGGTNTTTDAVYSWDKTGLELRQKWFNVTADCNEEGHYWWHGQGEQTGWFYNWTLNSAWHQFLPTATIGMYSGSNNKLYTKADCVWKEFGDADVNCLYEIGGVKKALVDGQFVALDPNNNDPAYHAADDETKYYICFEGCNWHEADKYEEVQKAYIISPDTFIWYDNAWMSVNFQEPFAYTMSETNVPIYYEYLNGEWVLAEPYVRVVDGTEDRSYYFIEDAFKFANSVLRTAPTITILRDISGITTALSYTGANKTCTLDLNGHILTSSCSNLLNINASGCVFTIVDNTVEKKGELRACPEGGNARTIGYTVTAGTLKLESGKMYSTNMTTRTGSTAATFTSATNTGVVVKANAVFTVTGGIVESVDEHQPYAVKVETNGTMNLSGTGVIKAHATKWYSTRGVSLENGNLNISGGSIQSTAIGASTVYGVVVGASASWNAAKSTSSSSYGILTMTGGEILARTPKDARGVQVSGAADVTGDYNESPIDQTVKIREYGRANISGGSIIAEATTSTTSYGVLSYGTTEISGGTITSTVQKSDQNTAYGVCVLGGTTTIKSGANITANAPTVAYGTYCSGAMDGTRGWCHFGILKVEGGTITANTTNTTKAYGLGVSAIAKNLARTDSYKVFNGDYAAHGEAIITGGTFIANAKTTTAMGIFVDGTKTLNAASATPVCTINGGYYKATGTGGLSGCNNVALPANFQINGGYYSHNGNLTTYAVSPKQVVTLLQTDPNRPDYEYKVAEAYTVTFKNGETQLQSGYQEVGKSPVYEGDAPTKASTTTASYVFDGWSTTDGGALVSPLPALTSAGATYYAHFAETTLKYMATFDAKTNGGNEDAQVIYVEPAASVGTLPTATKTGYTFNGWYIAASGGTNITSATVPTGDVTYFAQFTVNSHTLTWDLSGGTVSTAGKIGSTTWPAKNATGTPSTSVAYGTILTTIPVVTKTGYTFNRWNPVPTSSMPDEDVTYTALWNPNTNTKYTVKHYLQNVDGTYPAEPTETEALTGTTAVSVTPAVKSYEGFISPATQTKTIAADGKMVVEYLYARVNYEISLDATTNGGTCATDSVTALHEATISSLPEAVKEEGKYAFLGWFTKAEGGTQITDASIIGYNMQKLYAQFSPEVTTYTITWRNEDNSVLREDVVEFDAIPSNGSTPTKEADAQYTYTFNGWTPAFVAARADASYTATFSSTLNKYTITFKNGDDVLQSSEIDYGTPPSYSGTPTKPTTESYTYTFDGWTTEANGGGTFYAIGELPTVSAAATYYAHFTATSNVASVKVGSTTTYYTTIDAAFAHVNLQTADTELKLLRNTTAAASLVFTPAAAITCTFDLNNCTLSGELGRLIDVKLAKSTFIITDNSVAKGGKVDNNYNSNERVYGVVLTAGTLKLQGGTISSTNPHTYSTAAANKNSAATAVYVANGQTFTMENGTVESASQYASYAIYMARGTSTVTINNGLVKGQTTKSTTAAGIYNLGKGLTVNGGRIVGHAYTTNAYGIHLSGGHGTINGGTIEATNDTTSSKGTTTTYGIYVSYYSSAYKGVLTIPSTSTVNVLAKARTNTSYAVVVGGGSTGSTIAGGTFTAKTKTGKTASAVNSGGNITISGGTFIANSATTNAYGLYSTRGTITVNGDPTFNVTAGSTTAYGALAYGTIGKKGTGKYSGTIEINGGTFNVTSTKETAYGAYAGLASRDLRSCSATNDTVPGLHYMPGILVVNDGTFNVKATTTGAFGIVVANAKSESGTVGTTARIPLGTVTGGKFKVESMGDANATAYAMNSATTAARLVVQGGYYNTKRTDASETSNIEDKYTAPTVESNYHVLDLPEEELPYKYKVAEAYTVTFNANGHGTAPESQLIVKGQKATEPAAPTAEGYTFGGWYKEAGCTNKWDFASDVVNANTTLFAQWTPKQYTITFDSKGGSAVESITQDYTSAVTAPADPTKTGYTFAGWSPAVPSTMPAENTECVAQWTVNTHALTWNFDGGTPSGSYTEANNALAYGTAITYPILSKTGYTFAGWSSSATAMPDGDLTITANWTINQYTVSFNSNGGSEVSSITQDYNAAVTAPADPTREGYTFKGWDPAVPSVMPLNGLTCEAQWTPKQYTITFDSKGGSAVESITQGYTSAVTAPADPTKTGYTFAGWSPEVPETMPLNGLICEAQWTPSTYDITYKDQNDVEFSGVHGSGYPTKHTYGTPTALVNPTKAGYTFDGWYDNASCTGSALTEIGATAYTADFTLYAKWTIKSNCTIRWLNYNDTLLYESTIQREGTPCYPGHLGTPKRLGDDNRTYTFKGWSPDIHAAYDDETYTAQYSMSITTGELGTYTVSGTEDAVATTVQVTGALHVPEGKSLTTGDLIVEAYSDGSGTIDGLERVTVTGKAYFDYNFNTDPWHWSAFGVPFEIDLKAAAPLKETTTPMVLGSDYDIVYYDSDERAAHGPSGKCWKYVENDAEHKLTPGKLYMIAFNRHVDHVNVVRFTKATGAAVNYTADVPVTVTGTGLDNNWNGIANPRMYHALLDAGVTECQVHDGGEIGKDGYHTYTMKRGETDYKFFVGKAAFVQVPNEQKEMTTEPATNQGAIVKKAPRRAKAQEGADRYDVQIAPMAEEMSDRVFLLTDEDKADEYVIVSDLAKAGVSPVRPQMWVNRYGVKLCKNTVAMRENIADYPLGISVPADGDYDIFLGERPNNDDMLYLTYDGEAIWNLSYGACTIDLQRGTTDHYGLRVVAKTPQVATGIEETTIQNGDAVRKVIVEDKVFIIRNGQVYSIDGRLAK